MAESFTNSLLRAAGIVTTNSSAAVGVTTTIITGISTVGVAVSNLIDNTNFLAGTKVSAVGAGQVTVDRSSTNTVAATNQNVKICGVTTAFTSATGVKNILIGGTFANNTNQEVSLTVEVYDKSAGIQAGLASKIPVPSGSSFVISDAGKTVLESEDELRVYCTTDNAIDANLSILKGVS